MVKQTRIPNMMKALTSILKFITDATAMNLSPRHQERCLNFTTENLRFIITNLKEQAIAQQFTEEDIKDLNICLKSSFTYGAKLLNIVLKTCEDPLPQTEAYNLVNQLFNLVVSVEELLGYGCAARFITAVQPWLPDLILALGSHYLLKQTGDDTSENSTFHLPSWFHILARIELSEHRSTDEENSKEFSAFKRLLEMMLKLLSANTEVLDAVGVSFVIGSLKALRSKNFDVALGLARFVCRKLVRDKDTNWKELKWMLASLEETYSEVIREAEEGGNTEDDRETLYRAKSLLEPVWTSFIYDKRRCSMDED